MLLLAFELEPTMIDIFFSDICHQVLDLYSQPQINPTPDSPPLPPIPQHQARRDQPLHNDNTRSPIPPIAGAPIPTGNLRIFRYFLSHQILRTSREAQWGSWLHLPCGTQCCQIVYSFCGYHRIKCTDEPANNVSH